MTRNFARLSVVLAIFSLSACQKKARTPEELGKAYFRGLGCFKCHQVGSQGANVGPDLTLVGFRKTPEWLDLWLKDPPAWKKDTVMPRFYLKDDMRKAVVAYMASLKGQDWGDKKPWDGAAPDDPIKKGELIFNKAGCVACHGKAGVGGYLNNNVIGGKVPTLTKVADGFSKDELRNKISQGVPHSAKDDPNGPEPMISMPTWSQVLKPEEIEALVEYLYSLRPPVSEEEKWE